MKRNLVSHWHIFSYKVSVVGNRSFCASPNSASFSDQTFLTTHASQELLRRFLRPAVNRPRKAQISRVPEKVKLVQPCAAIISSAGDKSISEVLKHVNGVISDAVDWRRWYLRPSSERKTVWRQSFWRHFGCIAKRCCKSLSVSICSSFASSCIVS